MAKPILIANWKNHPASLKEAKILLKKLSGKRRLFKRTSLFIAPPPPYFEEVSSRAGSFSRLASQDIKVLPEGNYTGEVTIEIIKSFGVRLAILGHSERRLLGETSEDVGRKIRGALRSGITPLVCIGERERDKDGEHFEFLRDQLKRTIDGVSRKDVSRLAIAYEPCWAIGKGAKDAIDPLGLSQTIVFIRKILSDIFGRSATRSVPILYGGSVEPENARGLMETGIRGFLVGHASLKARSFEEIARAITEK